MEIGYKGSSSAIFRAVLLFHSHARGIWTVESSGFSLRAELSFGMGWNEGIGVGRGEERRGEVWVAEGAWWAEQRKRSRCI